ncbi:MAG: hypothetical protein ACRC8Y_20705 [Chroococcales cyanobacterium]
MRVIAPWSLVIGHLLLVIGHWSLVDGGDGVLFVVTTSVVIFFILGGDEFRLSSC